MADQYFIGDGNAGVANAGPLPRVGGVTSQAGVAWIGGPETGLNIGDGGWHATHHAAVAAIPAGGGGPGAPAVGEHYTLTYNESLAHCLFVIIVIVTACSDSFQLSNS